MKACYLPDAKASGSIIAVFLLTMLCLGQAHASTEDRVVESTHYSSGGRDDRAVIRSSRDTFEVKPVDKSGTRPASKTGKNQQRSSSNDFWIYDADVVLFADEDLDGFYSGIDLLFDADTIYSAVDVYAVVYLSFEGGAWEEYVVTENFTIFGATSGDDYSVVTDLVSGYPTGSYDMLIELFDAFNDDFLAYLGPEDSSELSFLPLEDIARDTPRDTTVVINTEGGGSADWLTLVLLPLVAIGARRLRRLRRDV